MTITSHLVSPLASLGIIFAPIIQLSLRSAPISHTNNNLLLFEPSGTVSECPFYTDHWIDLRPTAPRIDFYEARMRD